jgi:hypothetical protein
MVTMVSSMIDKTNDARSLDPPLATARSKQTAFLQVNDGEGRRMVGRGVTHGLIRSLWRPQSRAIFVALSS